MMLGQPWPTVPHNPCQSTRELKARGKGKKTIELLAHVRQPSLLAPSAMRIRTLPSIFQFPIYFFTRGGLFTFWSPIPSGSIRRVVCGYDGWRIANNILHPVDRVSMAAQFSAAAGPIVSSGAAEPGTDYGLVA